MHKRPENGIWLPTGGQLEMVIYVFLPRHKENKERKRKKVKRIVYKKALDNYIQLKAMSPSKTVSVSGFGFGLGCKDYIKKDNSATSSPVR